MKKAFYFIWPVLLIAALFGIKALMDGNQSDFEAGQQVYEVYCINCHMEQGEGLRGLYPPVASSDYVADHGVEMACGIVHGYQDSMLVNGVMYRQAMPGVEVLSDYEVTQVINYIKTAWGPQGELVEFEEVRATLETCEK